jgi:diguanylate cyclase (GGDEF)-like protein/PAS domain S-box-containing protein
VAVVATILLGALACWRALSLQAAASSLTELSSAAELIALIVPWAIVLPIILGACWILLRRAHENLATAYEELRSRVEQAPMGIAMFDRNMRYITASRRWIEDFGGGRSSLTGLSHYEVIPDVPESWREVHRRGMSGEYLKSDEDMWVRADGSRSWVRWSVAPWRDIEGEIGGITIYAEDVTDEKLAGERLRLAHAVFQNMQEGIVITSLEGEVIGVNPAFSAITEYSEAEVVGRHIRLLKSGRHDRSFYETMWQTIRSMGRWQGEMWDRRKSGELYPQWLSISAVKDLSGTATCYIGVVTDISRMHHAESHLQYLAHHDALTGLPNRVLLNLRLRHTLERSARNGCRCAVLFLDLDGFKSVNDELGHEAGDDLLRQAAERMRARLRDTDTLARLGGDEFVMVLEEVHKRSDAEGVAQHLVEHLGTEFRLAGGDVAQVGASIGISLFPDDAPDPQGLIRCADAALYEAKLAGRGTWRFYKPEVVSPSALPAG